MNTKFWRMIALTAALALLLAGCAPAGDTDSPAITYDSAINTAAPRHDAKIDAPTGDLVVITERLFIAQTNDIYINAADYLGKTIKYEGMFKISEWNGQPVYYVIRYGPGCCGYDGEAGFEVSWEGPLPKDDDWAEAVGVLEEYEEDGYMYLRLRLSSLTVLDTRGAEFVAA